MVRANGGLSDHVIATGAELILVHLSKPQFSSLNVAAERGTSDKMEATRQFAHDKWRRLEAEDCDRCE